MREMRRSAEAAEDRRTVRERHARELALKEAAIAELRAEVAALRRRVAAPEEVK